MSDIVDRRSPGISIVIPTDSWETVQPVLRCLERAGAGDRIEIVIVIPENQSGSVPVGRNVRLATVPSIYPLASARAAGVRAATAPYVFMGETHSFPRPGMFAAIIEEHERGATIVVPMFENENPDGLVSWAGFINGYAPWTAWRKGGEAGYAPLFNASYRRDFLTAWGKGLDTALLSGEDMMRKVRSANGYASFEPRARIGHVNIARLKHWLPQRIVAGRVIASIRSARWPLWRRLAYALAAPLIPLVLLARHWRGISGTIRSHAVGPAVLPVLGLGMFFQAVGEMAGYAAGQGIDAGRRYDEYEIRQLTFS